MDGFQYTNGNLDFFPTAEGYVKVLSSSVSSAYKYVFNYVDHLGNVRLSYSDSDLNEAINPATEIIEESNYYPFGLEHKGYNNVVSSNGNSTAQKFKYNGKELNEELGLDWYDFGARNYDASLGRWMNVDPLAENYFKYSPYIYATNDPIYYIDPDGMKIKDPDKVVEEYKKHIENTTKMLENLISSGGLKEEIGNRLLAFTKSESKKIKKLENSDQVYAVSSDTLSNEGGVTYNSTNGEVMIAVGKRDKGLIGHELNHAYQFEKGDISIMSDNSDYGSLYDLGDETKSYNVERAVNRPYTYTIWNNADVLNFGKTKMTPPAYQTLPTISINLKSKQGKNLRKRTIEAGKKGTPVKEVYIGWQKDYKKGFKKKK